MSQKLKQSLLSGFLDSIIYGFEVYDITSGKPEHIPVRNFIDPCIRLRRGHICRLDMQECKPRCPLHKTKEELKNGISEQSTH